MKTVLLSEINNGSVKIMSVISTGGEILQFIDDRRKDDDTGDEKPTKRKTDQKMVDKEGDWVKLYQDFALECVKKIKSLTVFKVLLMLMVKIRYGNKLRMRIKDLGAELGIDPSTVTRAMKFLQSIGVVYPIKRGEWDIPWRNFFKGDKAALIVAQAHETDRQFKKSAVKPSPEKKLEQRPQNMVELSTANGVFRNYSVMETAGAYCYAT